jgi:hypothetical protein
VYAHIPSLSRPCRRPVPLFPVQASTAEGRNSPRPVRRRKIKKHSFFLENGPDIRNGGTSKTDRTGCIDITGFLSSDIPDIDIPEK